MIGQNREGVKFLKSGEHQKGSRVRVWPPLENPVKKPKSKLKRFLIKHFKRDLE